MNRSRYPSPYGQRPQKKQGGLSAGAIVAIVLGTVVGASALIFGLLFLFVFNAATEFGGLIESAQERDAAHGNARDIMYAILSYENRENCMPRNIVDKNGTPILSWRTELLQFMDKKGQVATFDQSQAWNAGSNVQVASETMPCFHSATAMSPVTHFVAVIDEDTVINSNRVTYGMIAEKDGASRTGVVIEYPSSNINWAEPRDVSVAEAIKIIQQNPSTDGTLVGMADGSVMNVPASTSASEIDKLFRMSNGAAESLQ